LKNADEIVSIERCLLCRIKSYLPMLGQRRGEKPGMKLDPPPQEVKDDKFSAILGSGGGNLVSNDAACSSATIKQRTAGKRQHVLVVRVTFEHKDIVEEPSVTSTDIFESLFGHLSKYSSACPEFQCIRSVVVIPPTTKLKTLQLVRRTSAGDETGEDKFDLFTNRSRWKSKDIRSLPQCMQGMNGENYAYLSR